MLKPKSYNIAETNIALLGSDLEKSVKLEAAKGEKQWVGVGQKIGLEAWHIVNFRIVPILERDIGKFYTNDSYIILRTYKKNPESPKLSYDIHFWLGATTSQDEAGTAAYKTVELDDILGGAPIQHREIEGHESRLFLEYFKDRGGLHILQGGVASGFHHVGAETYRKRLLWVKGRRNIRIIEVAMTYQSMNSGDVFILDGGLYIYQWNGSKSGMQEKNRGAQFSRALTDERKGAKLTVCDEGDQDSEAFFTALQSKGPINSDTSVVDDEEWEKQSHMKLYRLSDASGRMTFSLVADGNVTGSMLNSQDVFILDVGCEIYTWIGQQSSVGEKRTALKYAMDYIMQEKRPIWLPISRILEGGESAAFEQYFRPWNRVASLGGSPAGSGGSPAASADVSGQSSNSPPISNSDGACCTIL